jgi:hypothetical protein
MPGQSKNKNHAQRERKREARSRSRYLAWVFIVGFPILMLLSPDGRNVVDFVFGPLVGGAMLLYQRLRPLPWPRHLASVDYVSRLDDYDGPDALPPASWYQSWCDCGWMGGVDHPNRELAEQEARGHTPDVRPGLHKTFEE